MRIVLKGGVNAAVTHRDGADGPSPQPDLRPRHDSSLQVHAFGAGLGAGLPEHAAGSAHAASAGRWTGERLGHERIEAVEQVQGPAHTHESRQLDGDGTRLEAFNGPLRHTSLRGELALGLVAAQPDGSRRRPISSITARSERLF